MYRGHEQEWVECWTWGAENGGKDLLVPRAGRAADDILSMAGVTDDDLSKIRDKVRGLFSMQQVSAGKRRVEGANLQLAPWWQRGYKERGMEASRWQ